MKFLEYDIGNIVVNTIKGIIGINEVSPLNDLFFASSATSINVRPIYGSLKFFNQERELLYDGHVIDVSFPCPCIKTLL